MKGTVKKANITILLLSIVLIVAIVCFAVLAYAWYTVSTDDVTADLNVEANSVYTFEVLRASFFTPNDVLNASVAYANNQYPDSEEKAKDNISKFKYATLDVDYKIYKGNNAESEGDFVFYVSGVEIYAPGTVSVYDEPLFKAEVVKAEDDTKIVKKYAGGTEVKNAVIIDRVLEDMVFSFAPTKGADNHAAWTEDQPAVWNKIPECEKTFRLDRSGTLYLAAAFNKYDDLIDEVIYSGIQIKVNITMERAAE